MTSPAPVRSKPVPVTDRDARTIAGGVMVAVLFVVAVCGLLLIGAGGGDDGNGALVGLGVFVWLVGIVTLPGFFVIQPNQSRVLIVLGSYVGTEQRPGFWWANPLSSLQSRTVSQRVRNFNSSRSKVNDSRGNPIEIAAVIVWQVVDSARAVFDVDDFVHFVEVQSETAVRHLAQQYPYDDYQTDGLSLTGNSDEVSSTLHRELQDRLDATGVDVIEARLTDLSYATEIAEAMLRRQQAEAIVAARETIVDGAVGMVHGALASLGESGLVSLDDEKRATMTSNLMTVLCSDQPVHPVVNVGSVY